MRHRRYLSNESGVALVTAMLVVMLMSALMVGMFAALTTDTRSHAADRDQTQAYAAAQAGLEKLTSALANLFVSDASPSVAQINQIASTPPVIPNFSFVSPGGGPGSGYGVTWAWTSQSDQTPKAEATFITTGPYTGFQGLITKYTATITAASKAGAEVRLRREIQTVAVPVFQFGVFSDSDLTFYAGDAFNFGGRVHTNGHFFACEFGPSMTFADRITAVGEAVHNYLQNTLVASTVGCTQPVNIATAPGVYRNWRQSPNEGSVTIFPGPVGSNTNIVNANTGWGSLSTGVYRNYIRTGTTGAKALNLPLVSQGAEPIDLIRRPRVNSAENAVNPLVFGQRFFAQSGSQPGSTSLRILLSDRVNDIMTLPTIDAGTAPVALTGNWSIVGGGAPAGYNPAGATPGVADATHPPIARSPGFAGGAFLTTNLSTYSAGTGFAQIYYTDNALTLPAIYKVPALTVGAAAVNCTGKTASSFTGCTPVPLLPATGIPAGTLVTANVNGVPVTTTTTAIAIGATTYTVAANGALPFSWNSIWVNNANAATPGTAVVVTCQGYTEVSPRHFINCSGLTGAPGNNTVMYATSAAVPVGTGLIGGFIKIEKQNNAGAWSDVTMEILNLGIGAQNQRGTVCADPTPNAIIRIQRLRDNGGGVGACSYAGSRDAYDWWPNTLYDTREGTFRDVATTAPMTMGGVIQYITLDARNLALWFSGAIGATGNQAVNNNGYIVYFSDRRGDHNENAGDVETGEYGFEDNVNPTVAGCCTNATLPDGALQQGEDYNARPNVLPTQEIYGETPWNNPANIDPGAITPYTFAQARPWAVIPVANAGPAGVNAPGAGMAEVNKVVLFRRALKVMARNPNGTFGINGGVNNLPASGLTIASENPVYVQGNYNATTVATAEPNVPAAIIADAITLLSNNWSDAQSFDTPTLATARNATTTGYRFAAVAGKGVWFPYCGANCANPGAPVGAGGAPGFLFGTDGGVGNFLRLLEDWNVAGVVINYQGSLISLYTSRQAIGTFKFNTNVYDFGQRVFTFDTDFLTPSLLPPGTPMFRDVNTLKFRQILRPNQ